MGHLNAAVGSELIKKIVHVTSLSFNLKFGGQRLDHKGPIERLSVDSWRLHDYSEAIKCPEFAKQIGTILSDDKKVLDEDVGEDEMVDDESMEDVEASSDGDTAEDGEGSGDGDSADDGEISGDGDMADDGGWSDVIEAKTILLVVAPDSCLISRSLV